MSRPNVLPATELPKLSPGRSPVSDRSTLPSLPEKT
jgi:hypothetical protein